MKAVRITRFGGAVLVTYDTPHGVMLAPADWTDNYLNKYATCRNLMIGMRGATEYVAVDLSQGKIIRYEITPVAEPAEQPAKENQ